MPLSIPRVLEILDNAFEILSKESTVVEMSIGGGKLPKLTICGDTHGQFYDVLNLFDNLNGHPGEQNPYLFNGDFVDRGIFGVELALYLLMNKVLFPNHVFLLRGNHESKAMTSNYGFAEEVLFKYNQQVLDSFYEVFTALPLAAVINESILVLHGGLFTDIGVTIRDLKNIDRFSEPPNRGLMHDCLWSDPGKAPGRHFNTQRNGGLVFGPDVTESFLIRNKLKLIVRSHEVRDAGFSNDHEGLMTIFSAPNYCDSMGNLGACLTLKEDLIPNILQFKQVGHPTIEELKARYLKSKL